MKIFEYIKSVNAAGTADSAKRFYGGIGFCFCIGFAFFNQSLQEPLMYLSVSLIGLETVSNIFKK